MRHMIRPVRVTGDRFIFGRDFKGLGGVRRASALAVMPILDAVGGYAPRLKKRVI
jgi:hypothetical protein